MHAKDAYDGTRPSWKAPIGLGLWVELCPYTPEAKGMRRSRLLPLWLPLLPLDRWLSPARC
jgi:hypothetical protein